MLVAQPLTEVEHELSRLLLILALIGAGGVVLAALLGALVARTALAPIARFTRRTETLTGSLDLSRRLEVEGRDELARLAESFNGTLDALERSVQAQRHLIADASHELRTPISSLRANIQILGEAERLPREEQESLRRDIVAELDELTALVGDVVELARGAAPDGSVDDVRLDEVVRAAVRARAGAASGGATRLRAEPRADDRARAGRPDRPGGVEPGGQRPQVEPGGSGGRGGAEGRRAERPRPRPGLPGRGPAVRVRPLLPRAATHAGSPARASAWRSCARRRRRAAASPRPRTPRTAARCCGWASGRSWSSRRPTAPTAERSGPQGKRRPRCKFRV